MKQHNISRRTYQAGILILVALVAVFMRRDYLTRRLLTRTINDIIEASRG